MFEKLNEQMQIDFPAYINELKMYPCNTSSIFNLWIYKAN